MDIWASGILCINVENVLERRMRPSKRHFKDQSRTLRLIPDMQTRAKNETARYVRPLVGQLQPLTPYPPDPVFIDDDDKSMDYGSVPADYEWE